MNPGGESADTLVKMYLSGVEMMIRLSGSALKNMLALSMALAKEHKKVSGKINLTKMLRQTRDLRTFTMTPAQYEAFKHLAKKHGILFAAVTDRDNRGKLVDVILPATELDRANLLFERILYNPKLGPDSPEPPQARKKSWWQRTFQKLKEKSKQEKPTPEREPEALLLEKGQEREHDPLREGYVPLLLEEGEAENPTQPVPEAPIPDHRDEYSPDILEQTPESTPEVILPGLPVVEEEVRAEDAEVPETEIQKDVKVKDGEKNEETKGGGEKKETVIVLPSEPLTYAGPPRESEGAQPEPVREDAPPSRVALPDTGRSSTPCRSGRKMITDERPSVLKRLEGFREQIAGKDAPAPEKGRNAERSGMDGRRTVRRDTAKAKLPVKGSNAAKRPVR